MQYRRVLRNGDTRLVETVGRGDGVGFIRGGPILLASSGDENYYTNASYILKHFCSKIICQEVKEKYICPDEVTELLRLVLLNLTGVRFDLA